MDSGSKLLAILVIAGFACAVIGGSVKMICDSNEEKIIQEIIINKKIEYDNKIYKVIKVEKENERNEISNNERQGSDRGG